MGFIRVKRISGKEYAYLVESKWYRKNFKGKGKGPRQRVSKYLGRMHSFLKKTDADFLSYKKMKDVEKYLVNNTHEEVVKDLVRWELYRHGVDTEEFSVDFTSKKVTRRGKEVTLKMNEGFLNSHTLRRLFNLKSNDSYYLAKSFIEAGIEIPKDIFVGLFSE